MTIRTTLYVLPKDGALLYAEPYEGAEELARVPVDGVVEQRKGATVVY
jgi:hypothetical protein